MPGICHGGVGVGPASTFSTSAVAVGASGAGDVSVGSGVADGLGVAVAGTGVAVGSGVGDPQAASPPNSKTPAIKINRLNMFSSLYPE
jgi:hypothetical protein